MQVVLNVFVGVDVLQCLGVLALQALEELHGGIFFLSWTQVPGVRRSGDDGEREDEYRCSGQHVFSPRMRWVPAARAAARGLRKSVRAASSNGAPHHGSSPAG